MSTRGSLRAGCWIGCALACVGASNVTAQVQPFVQRDGNNPLPTGPGQFGNPQGQNPTNGGGGAQADFQSLMQLIQSTIAPDSWDEVGGRGSIQPFPTGVYVDAEGVLRKHLRKSRDLTNETALKLVSTSSSSAEGRDERAAAPLRKISLRRLEQAVAERLAANEAPDEVQLVLAGLQHVRYVFLDPETGDVILAGPAGDWTSDPQGRVVSVAEGMPVVRLDDLVTLLRRYSVDVGTSLGCAITPRPERLAALQDFLNETSDTPLKPGQRAAWLETMRRRVGRQDVDFYGIEPTSRVAQVLIEADYHMKLVGIGLEPSPASMKSYLDRLTVDAGQAPPPLDVLRWWFTLDEQSVAAGENGRSYELLGDAVRVLSENELLAAQGQRVHTGASEPLNSAFAADFTAHFDELAQMYPVYGDLRNVFQLTLATALVGMVRRDGQLDWDLGCFASEGAYRVPKTAVPKTTDSVANVKVIRRRQILAMVSGGVSVAPGAALSEARSRPATALEAPPYPADDRWWWD